MTLNANKRNTNFSHLKNIYMVDTAVGSGKTYTSIQYMLKPDNNFKNFIYVAPTINLCDQTEREILEAIKVNRLTDRNILTIHGRNSGNTTYEALQSINSTRQDSGNIHIITTKTFINVLSRIANKSYHSVFMDEAFEPSSHILFRSKDNLEHCTDLFTTQENNRVVPHSEKKDVVDRIASHDFGADLYEYKIDEVEKMCEAVSNPAIWCEYAEQKKTSIMLATYLTPEYLEHFHELFFLSALFTRSILYHLWTNQFEINFKKHDYFERKKLNGEIRDTHGEQGRNIMIMYLLDKRDKVSRTNLQRNFRTGKTGEKVSGNRVIDRLNTYTHLRFLKRETRYLLALNSWSKDNVQIYENAKIISTRTHGSNDYSSYTNVAVLAATNPTNDHAKWLSKVTRLTPEEIRVAYNIDTTYQTFGRCAIRVKGNTKTVQLIVSSYTIAKLINEIFPDASFVGKFGILPSFSKLYRSNSDIPLGRKPKASPLRNIKQYQALMQKKRRLLAKKERGIFTENDAIKLKQVVHELEILKAEKT